MSTIAPVEDNPEDAPVKKLVKVSVTIDEAEFDRDIDTAFKTIAKEVKLPGFRPGKVPRKVLEARIGLAAAREQALRDAVPQYLANAVRDHDIDLISTPSIEFTAGQETGPVSFDATCEVRPEITVPGYGGLRVELTSPTATQAEIDEAVEAELRRQGTLVDVDRPVQSGDHVTVSIAGTRDGEPVAGLNTEDWLYNVGSGWVAESFDGELTGSSAGDELSFTATPNGTSEPADFVVNVSKVQEMVLPELTDDWVSDNLGEFDTVEQWRASLAERIGAGKLNQTRNQFLERTTSALAELVDIDPPESMVQADLQARVQATVQQLQSQGVTVDQWLQLTGQDAAAFVESLKVLSQRAVKVDLALRAVGVAEGVEVTDDDLNAEYARIATQVRQKPGEVRKAYEKNDAVTDLLAQMRKTKALDWLLEHVEVVDPEGNPIDRALVIGKTDHDHDHDHEHGDHDHDHHDHEHGDHDHEGHDHD
ncbi:MAG TPA: trigger factor [Ilumatobacteraceae bacterium]|nr:trigger factor [Ilumatobacteraceae bacterium]